jgi:hypothetical protein
MLDDFIETAAEMMSEFGATALYTKTIQGVYDPSTGLVGAPVVIEAPVRAIVMDLTLQSNGYSVKFGTQIQAGDKEIYVEPTNQLRLLGIDPATDSIKVGGVTYKVVTSKETNPTGTYPIMFYLYARR